MSESKEHREIVMQMAHEIRNQHCNITIQTDVQERPGDPVPQNINGYRPDIYAYDIDEKISIIGEAKTSIRFEDRHAHAQVTSFVQFLEKNGRGIFILGVLGEKADRARDFLRFIREELNITAASLRVYDGCDFWVLDRGEGIRWHLN